MDQQVTQSHWVDERYPIQTCDLGGRRIIGYRQAGAPGQPALILLHGIGSGSGSWVHQMEYFEDRYHLIAWDAPGYNISSPLDEEQPRGTHYARALVGLLTALNVQPQAVIGHSLGALIAGSYVAGYNLDLPVLILADPANGYGNAPEDVRNEKLAFRINLVRELGPDGMSEQRSANLLSANPSADAVDLVQWNMRKTTVGGYEQAAHLLAGGNLSGLAGQFVTRLLVLCGGEDQVTTVDACRNIAAAFAGARFEVLPGLGHASYVEGPDLFNRAVDKFLEMSHA